VGRPERDAGLQASPRARALSAGAGGGSRLIDAFASPEAVGEALAREHYLADRPLTVAIHLAHVLGQPLLLEGEAGVGKTEVAKALAATTGARLVRLQCHEGIDLHQALYDWDYARQLLVLRAAEGGIDEGELYSRRFLLPRPLLSALEHPGPVVLLIDEIDRADDAFEAFLLEFLSDFQVTIPELGTIAALQRPLVVLTSNRTRELHDALKRRCLYHWIDYPSVEREEQIVRARAPEASAALAARICAAVARLRELDLYKRPGVGESIAWARALEALARVGAETPLDETLGVALKVREDLERVRAERVLDDA
jgi:MoxR-like ATPase